MIIFHGSWTKLQVYVLSLSTNYKNKKHVADGKHCND